MCLRGSGEGNEVAVRAGGEGRQGDGERGQARIGFLTVSERVRPVPENRTSGRRTAAPTTTTGRVVARAGFHGGEEPCAPRQCTVTPIACIPIYRVQGSRSVRSKSLTRNRPNPRFRNRASSARQGGTLPSLSRKRLPPLSRVHTREDRPNIRATRSRNRRGFLLTLCASDTGIAERRDGETGNDL
jgi:hypothetical protein